MHGRCRARQQTVMARQHNAIGPQQKAILAHQGHLFACFALEKQPYDPAGGGSAIGSEAKRRFAFVDEDADIWRCGHLRAPNERNTHRRYYIIVYKQTRSSSQRPRHLPLTSNMGDRRRTNSPPELRTAVRDAVCFFFPPSFDYFSRAGCFCSVF